MFTRASWETTEHVEKFTSTCLGKGVVKSMNGNVQIINEVLVVIVQIPHWKLEMNARNTIMSHLITHTEQNQGFYQFKTSLANIRMSKMFNE